MSRQTNGKMDGWKNLCMMKEPTDAWVYTLTNWRKETEMCLCKNKNTQKLHEKEYFLIYLRYKKQS
jgi:hypothetical protein